MIDTLKKLNIPGICIINHGDKQTLISSDNLLSSICRKLPRLSDSSSISKIYTVYCPITRSLYVNYLSRLYNIPYNRVNWSVSISVKKYRVTRRPEAPDVYKAFVVLKNSYQEIVLGIFDSKTEAKAWKKEYLSELKYVVCYNELTREWYEGTKY